MAKVKFKLNRAAWGSEVMGSPKMQALMRDLGGQVAAKVPGGRVDVHTSKVAGGGLRARAWVDTSIPLDEEAETGRALLALRSVVWSGKATKRLRTREARQASTKRKARAKAARGVIRDRRAAKQARS